MPQTSMHRCVGHHVGCSHMHDILQDTNFSHLPLLQRYAGVVVPSLSHCSGPNTSLNPSYYTATMKRYIFTS